MSENEGGSMPGRTAQKKARKTKPPRDRSMLLGPAPDFKTLEAAMRDPDVAHDMMRGSQLRISAALVYLGNAVGPVLDALVREAMEGRQKVNAAKLLLEIAGVKIVKDAHGEPRVPREPEEDAGGSEEFDEILAETAQVFPIRDDREGTGGN